jgi:alkylation response protein AidB-like acyl-CoA dehydrogenase
MLQAPREVLDLLPTIAAAAEATERDGLSDSLFAALVDAGCYRLLPGSLPRAMVVLECLARADASTAWVVAQSALGRVIVGYLPPELRQGLGGDLPVAGVFAPKGWARRRGDSWEVGGRWPYASGVDRARIIYLQCLVRSGRRVVTRDGVPELRLAFLEPDQICIHKTWRALGLRGTASHDVEVRGARTPRVCVLIPGSAGATSRASLEDCGGFFVAAVACGIARGALDDVAALARSGKRATFSAEALAESSVFLADLGRATMAWRASRALLLEQAEAAEAAEAPQPRESFPATAAEVVRLAARAVDEAWRLAGTTAVHQGHPLERRMRDLKTLSQHAWLTAERSALLGGALVRG